MTTPAISGIPLPRPAKRPWTRAGAPLTPEQEAALRLLATSAEIERHAVAATHRATTIAVEAGVTWGRVAAALGLAGTTSAQYRWASRAAASTGNSSHDQGPSA